MGLHRRQLPIASPCERFEGTEATADRAAFCTRCDKHVHDLSRLTEPQVVDLLARNVGREVCVSYRTRPDGTIALRKPVSPMAPAAIALAMTGCAGHLATPELIPDDCVDAAGYHVECPPGVRLDMAVIPDHTQLSAAPAHADAPAEAAEDFDADLGSMPTMRGGVGGVLVHEPAQQPAPEPVPGPAEDVIAEEGEWMGGLVQDDDGPLSRKVKREARRIERRERRDARLARR